VRFAAWRPLARMFPSIMGGMERFIDSTVSAVTS
jgi:hypothetical protein